MVSLPWQSGMHLEKIIGADIAKEARRTVRGCAYGGAMLIGGAMGGGAVTIFHYLGREPLSLPLEVGIGALYGIVGASLGYIGGVFLGTDRAKRKLSPRLPGERERGALDTYIFGAVPSI